MYPILKTLVFQNTTSHIVIDIMSANTDIVSSNDMKQVLKQLKALPGNDASKWKLHELETLFDLVLQGKRMDRVSPITYRAMLLRIELGIHTCDNLEAKAFHLHAEHPQSLLTAIAGFAKGNPGKKNLELGELFQTAPDIFKGLGSDQSDAEPVLRQNIERRIDTSKMHYSIYVVYGLVFFAVLLAGMFMFRHINAIYGYILTASTLNHDKINVLLDVKPFIHIVYGNYWETGRMSTNRDPRSGGYISFEYQTNNSGLFATEVRTQGTCVVNNCKEFKVTTHTDIVEIDKFDKLPIGKCSDCQYPKNGGDCSAEFLKAMRFQSNYKVQCRALYPQVSEGADYQQMISTSQFKNSTNFYMLHLFSEFVVKHTGNVFLINDVKNTVYGQVAPINVVDNQIKYQALGQYTAGIIPGVQDWLKFEDDQLRREVCSVWLSVRKPFTTTLAVFTVLSGAFMARTGTLERTIELRSAAANSLFGNYMIRLQRMLVPNPTVAIHTSAFTYVLFPCSILSALWQWKSWMLFMELHWHILVFCVVGTQCYIFNTIIAFEEPAKYYFREVGVYFCTFMQWSPRLVIWLFGVTGTAGIGSYYHGMPVAKQVMAAIKLTKPEKEALKRKKAEEKAEETERKRAAAMEAKLEKDRLKAAAKAKAAAPQGIAAATAVNSTLFRDHVSMLYNCGLVLDIVTIINAVNVLYNENIHTFVGCMFLSVFIIVGKKRLEIYSYFWAGMVFLYIRAFIVRDSAFQNTYWRYPLQLEWVQFIDSSKQEDMREVQGIISIPGFCSYFFFLHGCFVSSGGITVVARGVGVLVLNIYNCKWPIKYIV